MCMRALVDLDESFFGEGREEGSKFGQGEVWEGEQCVWGRDFEYMRVFVEFGVWGRRVKFWRF